MQEDGSFNSPLPFDGIDPGAFDGLVLPGGHAAETLASLYLESIAERTPLQAKVQQFWRMRKPVVAVCHGVLVLSRAGVLGDAATPVIRTMAVTPITSRGRSTVTTRTRYTHKMSLRRRVRAANSTLALQTHCTLFGTAAPWTIAGLTWWRTGIFCALDPLENQMCGRTEPVGGE